MKLKETWPLKMVVFSQLGQFLTSSLHSVSALMPLTEQQRDISQSPAFQQFPPVSP
jgi:hypothetical protein